MIAFVFVLIINILMILWAKHVATVNNHPYKSAILILAVAGLFVPFLTLAAVIWAHISPTKLSSDQSESMYALEAEAERQINAEQSRTQSNIDQITQLHELLEKGALTQEEFEIEKAKLINV
ncbi:SHOCT domain-containing protein [Vibrio sp. WXL103]|uniref:SHOCT domain-containing protein n=1 Tax=unclassified Vibrio TaxID=2614977 RepID=UPI003EC9302C